MTATTASDPPARVVNRLRMTRSRILSSAPPMIMPDPSVTSRPLRLGGTLRGSLPNVDAPVRPSKVPGPSRLCCGCVPGRGSGGHGGFRREALLVRGRIDPAQEEGGEPEQPDAGEDCGARPIAGRLRPADREDDRAGHRGGDRPGE